MKAMLAVDTMPTLEPEPLRRYLITFNAFSKGREVEAAVSDSPNGFSL